MGTAYSALLSRLRTKVRETTANEWSDAELYQYLTYGERWLANFLSQVPNSGRFVYQEQKSLAASASTYALSGLTKLFVAVRDLYMIGPNSIWIPLSQFQEGDENLYVVPNVTTVSGLCIPSYRIREDDGVFRPVASSARTIVWEYNWQPAVKTTGADTADTPIQYDDLLVDRAAWDALQVIGEADGSFEEQRSMRIAEVEYQECDRGTRGVTTTPRNVSTRLLFS